MDDLGPPSSYLAVRKGVSVFSSDGEELGRLVQVLKDGKADMFDGIVFDTTRGPGGHKFVDAPEVGEIFERGVVLKIDASVAAKLGRRGRTPARSTSTLANSAGPNRVSCNAPGISFQVRAIAERYANRAEHGSECPPCEEDRLFQSFRSFWRWRLPPAVGTTTPRRTRAAKRRPRRAAPHPRKLGKPSRSRRIRRTGADAGKKRPRRRYR